MSELPEGAREVATQIAAVRQWAKGPLTEAAIDGLLEALTLRNEYLRDEVRTALRNSNAAPALFARAGDAQRPVAARLAALVGLRTLQPADASPLAALLNEREPEIRAGAAEALVVFGASTATPALMKALKDPVADVRYFAALAVAQLGTDEARQAISKAASDEKDPLVRDALMQAGRLLNRPA